MPTSIIQYYVLWYRLGSRDAYLLWYSNGGAGEASYVSGVVLDASGQLPSFNSVADLYAYAHQSGMPIKREEPILHNLDVVESWLKKPRKTTVDCQEFLAAWNLFDDTGFTLEGEISSNALMYNDIYDKLFWGNNLPGSTPFGEHYEPRWTKSEVGKMWNLFNKGMQMFKNRLLDQSTETDD